MSTPRRHQDGIAGPDLRSGGPLCQTRRDRQKSGSAVPILDIRPETRVGTRLGDFCRGRQTKPIPRLRIADCGLRIEYGVAAKPRGRPRPSGTNKPNSARGGDGPRQTKPIGRGYPSVPVCHHSNIPIRCRLHKQTQFGRRADREIGVPGRRRVQTKPIAGWSRWPVGETKPISDIPMPIGRSAFPGTGRTNKANFAAWVAAPNKPNSRPRGWRRPIRRLAFPGQMQKTKPIWLRAAGNRHGREWCRVHSAKQTQFPAGPAGWRLGGKWYKQTQFGRRADREIAFPGGRRTNKANRRVVEMARARNKANFRHPSADREIGVPGDRPYKQSQFRDVGGCANKPNFRHRGLEEANQEIGVPRAGRPYKQSQFGWAGRYRGDGSGLL